VTLFLFLCLFVGQVFRQIAARFELPYTSLITVLGLFLGIYSEHFGKLGHAIQVWSQFDPHLLLMVFLPPLIFESAFNSDWHIFKVELPQVLLMAGPMLLFSTCLSALMMRYILGYSGEEFPFSAAMLFGSIISATDPVAVVCLLKELGASKRLSTMIEGESLLNDGTAMVVFLVVLDIVEGKEFTIWQILLKFIRLSIGGPLLGIFCGVFITFILKRIHNNFVLEVNTTIFVCYVMFYTAESTDLHVSGILALVALGLYMTKSGKTRISAESEHSVHHIWGYFGFIAETTIFILTGIIMGERATHEGNLIGSIDYLKMFGSYIILHFIRFFSIMLCWPFLMRMGYGMTFKEVVLCSYAGLRGAVGMSLALMVAASNKIPRYIQDVILLHVAGVALLTLLINATTTGPLVKYLGLSKYSDLKKNILMGLTKQLDKNVDKDIEILKTKRHFNNVDWA
jgi:NhaP-type Na+/H+ or K+/H+ antiporter